MQDDWAATDVKISRFWGNVDRTAGPYGCWLWLRYKNPKGYGRVRIGERMVLAHRFAYEIEVGPIPKGLQIDRLCKIPSCVNPAHMEPVTSRENTLRGDTIPAMHAAKTHCIRGHEFTEQNTYMRKDCRGRKCRICMKIHYQMSEGRVYELRAERRRLRAIV